MEAHDICDDCWLKNNPKRVPLRINEIMARKCCYCGNPSISSITVMHDDKTKFMCNNDHKKYSDSFGFIVPKTAPK